MEKLNNNEIKIIKDILNDNNDIHSYYFEFDNTSLVVNFKDGLDDINEDICIDLSLYLKPSCATFSYFSRTEKIILNKFEDFEIKLKEFLLEYTE